VRFLIEEPLYEKNLEAKLSWQLNQEQYPKQSQTFPWFLAIH